MSNKKSGVSSLEVPCQRSACVSPLVLLSCLPDDETGHGDGLLLTHLPDYANATPTGVVADHLPIMVPEYVLRLLERIYQAGDVDQRTILEVNVWRPKNISA